MHALAAGGKRNHLLHMKRCMLNQSMSSGITRQSFIAPKLMKTIVLSNVLKKSFSVRQKSFCVRRKKTSGLSRRKLKRQMLEQKSSLFAPQTRPAYLQLGLPTMDLQANNHPLQVFQTTWLPINQSRRQVSIKVTACPPLRFTEAACQYSLLNSFLRP